MSIFFILSKILSFLINPLFWIGLLLIFALILKNKVKARKFLIASIICFFVFSNNFIVDIFIRAWEVEIVPNNKLKDNYDVGIVLGGGIVTYDKRFDRLIFRNNTDRLLQAINLYHKKRINKIMISGGSGTIQYRNVIESDLIKRYLIENNIPDSVILIDNKSDNTYQNAIFTKNIIREKKLNTCLLITSSMHIRRAKGCFEKQGLLFDLYPTDKLVGKWRFDIEYLLVPNIDALKRWNILLHEVFGYFTYKIMGYL